MLEDVLTQMNVRLSGIERRLDSLETRLLGAMLGVVAGLGGLMTLYKFWP
jgi:hypothetical protein